jgi:hypothetical protein
MWKCMPLPKSAVLPQFKILYAHCRQRLPMKEAGAFGIQVDRKFFIRPDMPALQAYSVSVTRGKCMSSMSFPLTH